MDEWMDGQIDTFLVLLYCLFLFFLWFVPYFLFLLSFFFCLCLFPYYLWRFGCSSFCFVLFSFLCDLFFFLLLFCFLSVSAFSFFLSVVLWVSLPFLSILPYFFLFSYCAS